MTIKTIVIVEDNALNLKLLVETFKIIPGVQIFSEMRGDSGLELLKKIQPNLVVLDIQLPNLSGIEICKELKKMKRYNNIPIIAITAYAMKGDEERILRAGFDQYFSKPINVKEIRERIIYLLNKNNL